MDHEPIYITILIVEEVAPMRLLYPDTLGYSVDFDPMQYFWPVEGQHCVAIPKSSNETSRKRLAKALLRDKAAWVSIVYDDVKRFEHWGDSNGFMQQRYGGIPVEPVGPPT